MPIDADALEEWSRRHGGYDASTSVAVRGWLALVHALARPLARRGWSPDAVSLLGVVSAGAACVAPRRAGAALVLTTAVLDGVDGALALQRGCDSRHGVAVDHLADRGTDVLFAVALARAGCPRRLATAAAGASVGYELLRDGLRFLGRDTAAVTVGDRPFRVGTVAVALVVSPTAGAGVAAVQSAAGAVQLLRRSRAGRG